MEDVRADILRRTDPDEYASQMEMGYIKGAEVGQPAVIAINTIFSAYGVMEMLCRLHHIRDDGNAEFASQRWSLSGGFATKKADGDRCPAVSRNLGRGDMSPLLGLPELSVAEASSHATC